MTYERILYEKRDNTAIITMNRPEKLNAWTYQMSAEMTDAIGDANRDDQIASIILTATGRGFCAGVDVKEIFESNMQARDRGDAVPLTGERSSNWVETVRTAKPMIAAVNGLALGVGVTLVSMFDVVIVSEEARFACLFVKMGLVPELASTYFLVQRVGFGNASELMLSGRYYSAEEMGRIGYANRVVPHERLMDEAMATAAVFAGNPTPQMVWIKELINKNACNSSWDEAARLEFEMLDRCHHTPEHREAIAAFKEKRPAKFR